jgi:outer membrane receptor protein involved in Fe transport
MQSMSLDQLLELPLSTGSFLELDLKRSPVSMSVIEREQIKASAARTMSELLEIYVPGFQYMYNKWNGEIWGMRGVAADRNTKVIFLINGLKQNTESRDGAYTEMDLGLLDDIERVEVLRGPAGVVYGSGAIAGVVNVVTRRPNQDMGDAVASYGSANSVRGEALVHRQGKHGAMTLSAGYRRASGFGPRSSKIFGQLSWPTVSDPDGDPVTLPNGVAADGNPAINPGNVRASADFSYRDFRWYTRFTREQMSMGQFWVVDPYPDIVGLPPSGASTRNVLGTRVSPTDPLATTESFGTNRRRHIVDNVSSHVQYAPAIGKDQLKLEGAVILADNRITYDYRRGYAQPGQGQRAGEIFSSMGERRYYMGAQYLLRRVDRLQSAAGMQVRVDDLGSDLSGLNLHGGVGAHKEISDVVYTNFAVYDETYYQPHDKVMLVLGARLDKHTRTGFVFSPKGALVVMPSPTHSIKLIGQASANNGSADNYEYNWRHFDDQGQVAQSTHLDNPNIKPVVAIPRVTQGTLHKLRPERAYSFELASTHVFENIVTLMPSLSYTDVHNLFAWNQELFRVVNAGEYRTLALELDARLDLRSIGVSGGLSHAFQRPIASSRKAKTFQVADWVAEQGADGLWSVTETGGVRAVQVSAVRDQVTRDGKNFLNLNTNISKLYLDYAPLSWLSLHTDLRIFWGLRGRSGLQHAGEQAGNDYLNIAHAPSVKWNLGARCQLPRAFTLSMHAYNLLGSKNSRNAVRWQQMADPSQQELYTVDLRYFMASLEKTF